jgi:hypothetical protein
VGIVHAYPGACTPSSSAFTVIPAFTTGPRVSVGAPAGPARKVPTMNTPNENDMEKKIARGFIKRDTDISTKSCFGQGVLKIELLTGATSECDGLKRT